PLNILDVLYEESHILAVLDSLALAQIDGEKRRVLGSTILDLVYNEIALLAVERHNSDARRWICAVLPEMGYDLYNAPSLGWVRLFLVGPVHSYHLDRFDPSDLTFSVAGWHVHPAAIEGCIRKVNELAIFRSIVNLQCGDRKAAPTQRQEVWAVFDLTPVPGLLVDLALRVRAALVKILAVEFTFVIAVGPCREEARRRHLFLVPTDDYPLSTIEGWH